VRGKIFWFKARLMKLADINTQTLSALLSLTKKKETLLPKGLLKEQITSILNAAGEAGSSVKEIAEKVGKPIQHIYVWFSGTGKKLGMFDKMGEGKYRIKPAQH
jgi:hypothetical protein